MYVHSPTVGVLAVALSLAACGPVTASERPSAVADAQPGGNEDAALCGDRASCVVLRRRPVSNGLRVVDLRIADTAKSEDEQCDRREYWLVREAGPLLLAADCEKQWGADSQGPATTRVKGSTFVLRYVEYQADDRCEIFEAEVDLTTARIRTRSRTDGTVVRDQCKAGRRREDHASVGSGGRSNPLLTLHRP